MQNAGPQSQELPRSTAPRGLAASLIAAALSLLAAASAATDAPEEASDPCAALERTAVAAIQETAVVDATGTRRSRDGRIEATCFVRGADFGRSVSFELVGSEDALPTAAQERWRELFDRARVQPGGADARRPRRLAGDATPADAATAGRSDTLPVAGLGDEAYFVGTAVYGALYVLRGPNYFRLSVGGPGDLDAKLGRARALAEHALHRLDAVRSRSAHEARSGGRPLDDTPSPHRGPS